MNWKASMEGYISRFGRRRGEGEIVCLYHNFKNKKKSEVMNLRKVGRDREEIGIGGGRDFRQGVGNRVIRIHYMHV